MTTSPMETIAVSLLEGILNIPDDNVSQETKTVIRNLMIPVLEYIDDAETPPETIKRAYLATSLLVIPIALAIDKAIRPVKEAKAMVMLSLAQKFAGELEQVVLLLDRSRSEDEQHEQDGQDIQNA